MYGRIGWNNECTKVIRAKPHTVRTTLSKSNARNAAHSRAKLKRTSAKSTQSPAKCPHKLPTQNCPRKAHAKLRNGWGELRGSYKLATKQRNRTIDIFAKNRSYNLNMLFNDVFTMFLTIV
jgi:hypothetical protein